jgi:RimJ/RimL family protein N-acetyltransferase
MKIVPIEHKHYAELFRVTSICEPWWGLDRNTSDRLFSKREGFVLIAESGSDEGKVVGHITLSDYTVKLDVFIHCSILPEYQRRWLNKTIYRTVFDYVFNVLECVRATGWATEGLNDLTFHERLGFKREGVHRQNLRIKDKYYDMHYFGMLKNERRW